MRNRSWHRVGVVAPGGTVFDVLGTPSNDTWVVTGAGLFQHGPGGWHPVKHSPPVQPLQAFIRTEDLMLAGGLGQIAYSANDGATWWHSRVRHVSESITCFATSPRFRRDSVVLAGTAGSGILRSTDGGRSWRTSNFGLQDLTILAIKTAPEWEDREVVFAATESGLYRSPNGGRAWKLSDDGIDEAVVQTLAISQGFVQDKTVFLGTEEHGLFRSTDGGLTWHSCSQGLASADGFPSINAIWLHPDFPRHPIGLVGTADGCIFRSQDGSAHWTPVAETASSVLCLANAGQQIFAGLDDQGLLRSDDDGCTWTAERTLAARDVKHIMRGAGDDIYAVGPMQGIWKSTDAARTWHQLPDLLDALPLLAVGISAVPDREYLLAGIDVGLSRSSDGGQTWQTVQSNVEATSICFSPTFAADGLAWFGTWTGDLWMSSDHGLSWNSTHAPSSGNPLIALRASALSNDTATLAAVTFDQEQQQLVLWQSDDAGSTWAVCLRAPSQWPVAHLDAMSWHSGVEDQPPSVIALGSSCWRRSHTGWQNILNTNSPILRLLELGGASGWLVATTNDILHTEVGETWSTFVEELSSPAVEDIVAGPSDDGGSVLYLLTTGGTIWQRHV